MHQSDRSSDPRVSLVRWLSRPEPPATRGISSDPIVDIGGLTIVVVRLAPGAEVPRHRHEHSDEIFDVIQGRGEVLVGESWTELELGTTAIVEAGVLHGLRNPHDEPLVLRETVRRRVYAREAIRSAIGKRLKRFRRSGLDDAQPRSNQSASAPRA